MWENNSCRKVMYTGDVQEPKKVNNTCTETMHAGTMDRGFTVTCDPVDRLG
jgi:acetyl-CoA carboxylase beta subunit